MFLYELALELGIRSPDLVARAQDLGLPAIGPGSMLTPAQVVSLRTGIPAPPPIAPPPPPSATPHVVVGPPGPITGPPAPGPTPPPAVWPAPRSPVPAEPLIAAGLSGPLPPPPGRVAGPDRGPGPVPFADADIPASAALPGGPSGADPGRPKGLLVAMAVLVPLVIALFAYMATHSEPKRRLGGSEAATGAPSGPGAERPADGGGVVGGIGAPGTADADADADAGPAPAEDEPEATAADPCPERIRPAPSLTRRAGRPGVDDGCDRDGGGATDATDDEPGPVAPVTPDPAPPADDGRDELEPVDVGRFCAAARGITAFELEVASAALRDDVAKLRSVLLAARGAWATDAQELLDTAPGYLVEAVTTYREAYSAALIPMTEDTADGELTLLLQKMAEHRVLLAGQRINLEIGNSCR